MKLWTRVVSCRNAVWEMASDVDGIVCMAARARAERTRVTPRAAGTREWTDPRAPRASAPPPRYSGSPIRVDSLQVGQ